MKSSTLVTLFVPVPANYRDGHVHIVEHRYTAHREFVRVFDRGVICQEWAEYREAGESPIIRVCRNGWDSFEHDWQLGNSNNDVGRKHGYWTLEANL